MDGHALMQIDQARGEGRHWKEQFERADQEARGARTAADSYRGKAATLEASLAGATARLNAVQESLVGEKERCASLLAQLAAEQEANRRQADELIGARVAVEARLDAASLELSAVRSSLDDARVRELRAIEEAAVMRGKNSELQDRMAHKDFDA